MTFTKDMIGLTVEFTDDFERFTEGCTGIIRDVNSWNEVIIDNIEGTIRLYCYDCKEYNCGCNDEEDYDENYNSYEQWNIPGGYLKLLNPPSIPIGKTVCTGSVYQTSEESLLTLLID